MKKTIEKHARIWYDYSRIKTSDRREENEQTYLYAKKTGIVVW